MHQVPLYLHRPDSSSTPGIAQASEDEQSGQYPSSEEEDLQLVSLIQIATTQTSSEAPPTCDSFIMDASVVTRRTNFPIASGGLADVYKCTLNRGTGPEEVAVKSPRFPSLTDAEIGKINRNIDREIEVWTGLDHQYVLHLYGIVTGFGPFRALVTPWMPNGTLNSYLCRPHETLTTMRRLRILQQITEGLRYLHDNDVIHGDLTSNNVLVDADGSPRLADFGVSNIMVESNPAFSYHSGAVRWAAPELIDLHDGQTVPCTTKSSDIYALGCIMLQVLYDKLPYWWIKAALKVIELKFKHQEPINDTVQIPAYYRDFMWQCWSRKRECRPVVEEVLDFLEEAICVLGHNPSKAPPSDAAALEHPLPNTGK